MQAASMLHQLQAEDCSLSKAYHSMTFHLLQADTWPHPKGGLLCCLALLCFLLRVLPLSTLTLLLVLQVGIVTSLLQGLQGGK